MGSKNTKRKIASRIIFDSICFIATLIVIAYIVWIYGNAI